MFLTMTSYALEDHIDITALIRDPCALAELRDVMERALFEQCPEALAGLRASHDEHFMPLALCRDGKELFIDFHYRPRGVLRASVGEVSLAYRHHPHYLYLSLCSFERAPRNP